MWHKEDDEKSSFGGEPNEKYQSKIPIKKESGEEGFLAQLINHKNQI